VFLRADEEIADDVTQVLGEIFGPDSTDVTVSVRNGVVTVTTAAGSATEGHDELTLTPAARRLIWGVDGVINVMDKLHAPAA
jgi:osmotically-inducible protein OsmY